MKTIIFALALIVLASSTQADIIAKIKKIDNSPFGRTLFDTIWLELQTGDPLDRLIQTLTDLEDRYVAEQKEDDARNHEYQDACTVDISAFDKDLAESNRKKIELEARLEGQLYPQREILQGLVAQKQAEVKGYQKDLDELDAQRAEENADFEEKVLEHQEATAIIAEARRLFADNIEHESFIQKGKATKKPAHTFTREVASMIQKHFTQSAKKTAKFQHRKGYSKLFKAFATIASKAEQLADAGAVQKIIDLADELLAKIADSLALLRFAEDKRVEAYKKQRNFVVIAITVAGTSLANAQADLAALNDLIAQVEATLDTTNQRIENVTADRTDRFTQCEEAVQDYEDSRAARTSDRDVVSETIGLVNKELRTLREQLALRQSAGDEI
ncbi:unnamed protein product (macronuclear) [Paramecium tetraurelia]|uniref:Uncharacterized protein n=1 Tax=Paramecium tetraurelia TaxID=5888 RepID=A0D9B2_PARTE|nr:uncharacterized protein GSPATT00014559001 [Paramecium tetraurelia]CAK79629.1 unnamed protein product [Paramecium tetraurelia]|eukprot:XP_001447026.1 hypothetical protein (macronuclear) [Paramecium tetraurelia strain d4-2]